MLASYKGKWKTEEDVTQMNEYMQDTENTCSKLVAPEDRSSQNNIMIDWVMKDSKESWKECERRLKGILDIKNMKIERVHTVVRKSGNKPSTLVCKLLQFRDKQNISRKTKLLKGIEIFINENFFRDTVV